jgi:hypothetical protein
MNCPVCNAYVDPAARPRFQRIHVGVDNRVRLLQFHWRCEEKLVAAEKAGQHLLLTVG